MITPHEQMLREAVSLFKSKCHYADEIKWLNGAQQALAATPEPAPMVRLTEEDAATCWNIAHESVIDKATGYYKMEVFDWAYANALQDAWIAKNGGK